MQPLAIYTVSTTKTNHPFNLTSSHRKVWRLEAAQGGYPSGAPTGHQWCLEVKRGDMMSMGISYPSLVFFFSLLQGDFFFEKAFWHFLGCLIAIHKMLLIYVFSCFGQIVNHLYWRNWFLRVVKRFMCPSIHVDLCLWPVFTVVFASNADLFSSKISFYSGAWDMTYFR